MENKEKIMVIETWFPTLIGFVDNPDHKKIEKKLTEVCKKIKTKVKSGGKNWVSKDTYNTIGTCDLKNKKEFLNLNKWITDQVSIYCNKLNYKNNFILDEAWFNIYNKNDFQEYHSHPKHSLSAVYFLNSPEKDSANIFFESPINSDSQEPTSEPLNSFTFKTANYYPKPGRLIIFRSNIKHCVERHNSNKLRISLAYNFKIV